MQTVGYRGGVPKDSVWRAGGKIFVVNEDRQHFDVCTGFELDIGRT
jgi:hypothetical protein